jgi:ribosomal protein L37E
MAAALPQGADDATTGTRPDLVPSRRPLSDKARVAIAHKHACNLRLAERLEAAGLRQHSEHLRTCTVTEGLHMCGNCGALTYHVNRCKLRFCAFCAPVLSAKRARAAREAIKRMQEPKWLTLTMKTSVDLQAGIQKLRKAFNRWRKRRPISANLVGGIYKIEVKPKPGGWHVHLHAIVDMHYTPIELIWSSWAKAVGQDFASARIMRIQDAIHSRDLCKYNSKLEEIVEWSDSQIRQFITVTHKTRMFTTFGTLYNQKLDALLNTDPTEAPTCPRCGKARSTFPISAGFRHFGHDWPDVARMSLGSLPETRPRQDICDNVAIVLSAEA